MQVSHTSSGLYLYLTPAEISHLGGLGVRVDVEMSSYTWVVTPRSGGRYRVIAQAGNKSNPGRIMLQKRDDLNLWGATFWASSLKEGNAVQITVGTMDTPLVERKPLAQVIRTKSREMVTPRVMQMDNTSSLNLRDAVEEINRHRDRLRDHLVLSIDKNGYLTATVEYGRPE